MGEYSETVDTRIENRSRGIGCSERSTVNRRSEVLAVFVASKVSMDHVEGFVVIENLADCIDAFAQGATTASIAIRSDNAVIVVRWINFGLAGKVGLGDGNFHGLWVKISINHEHHVLSL